MALIILIPASARPCAEATRYALTGPQKINAMTASLGQIPSKTEAPWRSQNLYVPLMGDLAGTGVFLSYSRALGCQWQTIAVHGTLVPDDREDRLSPVIRSTFEQMPFQVQGRPLSNMYHAWDKLEVIHPSAIDTPDSHSYFFSL